MLALLGESDMADLASTVGCGEYGENCEVFYKMFGVGLGWECGGVRMGVMKILRKFRRNQLWV